MADLHPIQDLSFGAMAVRVDTSSVLSVGPQLFDPNTPGLNAIPVSHGGRQAAWFVAGDFGEGVLRHYRRGGLMAKVNQCSYLWTGSESTRAFAEFQLLTFMFKAGLPVPQPLAACYTRHGLFYTAAILIQRISGVQTLAKALDMGNHSAVAAAVLAMHNAGVWHADLNAYNILVNDQGQVWLIDFDKGRRLAITPKHRAANLARLQRSLIKVAGDTGNQWWQRFNQAYMDQARVLSPP